MASRSVLGSWSRRARGVGPLVVGLLAGCADSDPSATPSSPAPIAAAPLDFGDVHPIFVAKCADQDCHGGGSIVGFARMDRAAAYDEGVAVFEFMWGRLSSGNMPFRKGCASDGEFVEPPPPGCLDPMERDRVRRWLEQGYPE